jgi:hypothetical protein
MMKRVRKPAGESGRSVVPQNSQFVARPFAPKAEEPEAQVGESRVSFSLADIDIFPRETVQPKLRLGPVGDRYEREADRVARRVIRIISSPDPGPVQRQEDLIKAKEEAPPNRTGMPGPLKSGLEDLSGMDLSGMRVQYSSPKPAQLNALAYTHGQEIHVAPGQERHLPHEGWHAVQQMQGRVRPTMQAKGVSINDDAGLEREADVLGTKALQMTGSDQVATRSTSWVSKSLLRRKRAASPFPVPKSPLADTSSALVQEDVIQVSDSKPSAPSVQRKVTINGKETDSIIGYLIAEKWDELISPDEAEVAGWLLGLSPTWNFSGPEDLILYVNKVYSMTKLIRSVFATGILSRERLNQQKIDFVGSEDSGEAGGLAVNVLDKRGGKRTAQEIADESMIVTNNGSISVALERQNDWLKASPDEDKLLGEWTKPEHIVLTSADTGQIQKAEMESNMGKMVEEAIRKNKAYQLNEELLNKLYGPEMEERAQNTIMAIVPTPDPSVSNLSPRDGSYESSVPSGMIPSGAGGFTTLLIPQWFKPFYQMLEVQQHDSVEVRFVDDKTVTANYKSSLGNIPVTVNAPDYAGEVAMKLEEFKTIATHILTA